jgi:phage tail sheath gpL-like
MEVGRLVMAEAAAASSFGRGSALHLKNACHCSIKP